MNRYGYFFAIAAVLVAAIAIHDLCNDSETDIVPHDQAQIIQTETNMAANVDNEPMQQIELQSDNNATLNATDQEPSFNAVTKWVEATDSGDEHERDAANNALLKASREKVLPILQQLIVNGEANDRQLALNAMHMIALKRGDASGEIQNMLRLTSYDGDEAIAGNAQLALEDIESGGGRELLVNP